MKNKHRKEFEIEVGMDALFSFVGVVRPREGSYPLHRRAGGGNREVARGLLTSLQRQSVSFCNFSLLRTTSAHCCGTNAAGCASRFGGAQLTRRDGRVVRQDFKK